MTKEDIIRFIKRNIGDCRAYNNFIGSNKYVQCAYLYFYKKQNTEKIERCVKMFMEAFEVKDWRRYKEIGFKKSNKSLLATNEAIFEGLIDNFIIEKRNFLVNE